MPPTPVSFSSVLPGFTGFFRGFFFRSVRYKGTALRTDGGVNPCEVIFLKISSRESWRCGDGRFALVSFRFYDRLLGWVTCSFSSFFFIEGGCGLRRVAIGPGPKPLSMCLRIFFFICLNFFSLSSPSLGNPPTFEFHEKKNKKRTALKKWTGLVNLYFFFIVIVLPTGSWSLG